MRQQQSFSTQERMFLGKCQSFWDRKCLDLRQTRTPTSGFMPNALTIWAISARHLLSHDFEHGLWRYRYFLSKANIWNANCSRTTAFISDTANWLSPLWSNFDHWPYAAWVCIVTGLSWWILHSGLVECSFRDNSRDLHSGIPPRSGFLLWYDVIH